jgi:hypothetical protein
LLATVPEKPVLSEDAGGDLIKMNGSAANPDSPNPPAVAVPETLSLPDAAAIIAVGGIGRTAISISISGSIVIAGTCQRASDDSAADDPGCQPGAETALGMGRRRR